MDFFLQFLAFVITILVLVSIHEAGHFVVAKMLGVKVIRYAIGFGKSLYRHVGKSGTEYVIGLIPLGGYVKLLDEREVIVPQDEQAATFNHQPLWARTLIVLAGPLTNLLFAIFSFWLMFMIGVTSLRPIIGDVIPSSIAAQAGLQKGQQIEKVDHQVTPTLQKAVVAIVERLGEKNTMTIEASLPPLTTSAIYKLNLQGWSVNDLNPDPLKSLGIVPYRPDLPAVLDVVQNNGPAAKAGLKPNDKILSINGQPVKDWYTLLEYVQKHPREKIVVTYERNGELFNTNLVIGQNFSFGVKPVGRLGVKTKTAALPDSVKVERRYPPLEALQHAVKDTWEYLLFNMIILKKMVMGQISLSTLGGPIAIFQTADLAFKQGVSVFLGFLGLISIMLAFLNFLPIPGLDGGHLFNFLIEFITGKPVPLKYELISIRIGFFLLLIIMVMATLNDILRIFIS